MFAFYHFVDLGMKIDYIRVYHLTQVRSDLVTYFVVLMSSNYISVFNQKNNNYISVDLFKMLNRLNLLTHIISVQNKLTNF